MHFYGTKPSLHHLLWTSAKGFRRTTGDNAFENHTSFTRDLPFQCHGTRQGPLLEPPWKRLRRAALTFLLPTTLVYFTLAFRRRPTHHWTAWVFSLFCSLVPWVPAACTVSLKCTSPAPLIRIGLTGITRVPLLHAHRELTSKLSLWPKIFTQHLLIIKKMSRGNWDHGWKIRSCKKTAKWLMLEESCLPPVGFAPVRLFPDNNLNEVSFPLSPSP